MYKNELILCIVNQGFSGAVMDTAKRLGAKGGTVLSARGTASKEAEMFFNITIQAEKEIVMILVPSNIKDDILKGLYDSVGSDKAAQGIAFSLPVDNVIGLSKNQTKEEKAE
jgi:succinyl-CoA synthetase beta subunit